MQIQNPLDQDAVKKGVEDVGEDLLSELPGLTPGQAIIAGDSVNTPFLARIRERIHSARGGKPRRNRALETAMVTGRTSFD